MIVRPLNIVVASLTRNRPVMLKALLESWAVLEMPKDAVVRFLVVENDIATNSLETVEFIRASYPTFDLDYVLETKPGIPAARNRAMQVARELGAEVFCFVDDDEFVAKEWLVEIVAEYRRSHAAAIGGPTRPSPPMQPLDQTQQALLEALLAGSLRREAQIAKKVGQGSTDHLTISTNNCLYDLAALQKAGLEFDDSMIWSGGSDAKLSSDIRKKGLGIGWAPKAIVYETQPVERLGYRYFFSASRDRATTYVERKFREHRSYYLILPFILAFRCLAAILVSPVAPIRTDLRLNLTRNLGWIVGAVGGIFNRRSMMYKKVTGF